MLNRYAFINSANGYVDSIVQMDDSIPWEAPAGQTAILLSDDNPVQVGWTYNGGETFSKIQGETKIDRLEFMRRFTTEETIAMNVVRKTIMFMTAADYQDPTKQYLTELEIILQRFNISPQIDLEHPETISALTALANAGVVTQERIPDILSY